MTELIKEVKELKALLKEKKISPGVAARFIEVSERHVYRWIDGQHTPRPLYRKMIRRGIRRIRKLF